MPEPAFRVLVTGSRAFPSRDAVWEALASAAAENVPAGGALVVVHGDCPGESDDEPTGADYFAHLWCERVAERGDFWGIRVIEERHPADWGRACDEFCHHRPRESMARPHCPRAGVIRSQKMVDLGAHLALGFPLPGPKHLSKGTWHCIDAARRAGLHVEIVDPGAARFSFAEVADAVREVGR